MADLRRRVSHINGLIDRFGLDEGGTRRRILREVANVLGDLAESVEELTASQFELEDYVSELDDDLMELEEGYASPGPARGLHEDGRLSDLDDEDIEDEDERLGDAEYIELECPVCERSSFYNEALFERDAIQLTCPHCGNVIFDADEDLLVMEDQSE